jgi:hypothetical protein
MGNFLEIYKGSGKGTAQKSPFNDNITAFENKFAELLIF